MDEKPGRLHIVPVTFREACIFIANIHRHNAYKPTGKTLCCAVQQDDKIVGVAIAGQPSARLLNDGWTMEITRTCVIDGVKNANSILYGAICRAAFALGFYKVITYTNKTESGSSLRGAGFTVVAECKPSTWVRPNRIRIQRCESQPRLRWEKNNADSVVNTEVRNRVIQCDGMESGKDQFTFFN